MARTTEVTYSSDKSGQRIEPNTGGRVRIMFFDKDRVDMRADLTDAEIEKLLRDYKLKEVETRPQRAGETRRRMTL